MNLCKNCGFRLGERVRMRAAILGPKDQEFDTVHGVVELYPRTCHIAVWSEYLTSTPLPDENVERDN